MSVVAQTHRRWSALRDSGDMLSQPRTSVLLAVVAVHARRPPVTMGDLVALLGLSRSTIHGHLVELRRDGLVTWEYGTMGTLRPLVHLAPVT